MSVIRFIDFVLDLASTDNLFTYNLGTQASGTWNPGTDLDDFPSISYSNEEKQNTVELVCSNDGTNRF